MITSYYNVFFYCWLEKNFRRKPLRNDFFDKSEEVVNRIALTSVLFWLKWSRQKSTSGGFAIIICPIDIGYAIFFTAIVWYPVTMIA